MSHTIKFSQIEASTGTHVLGVQIGVSIQHKL